MKNQLLSLLLGVFLAGQAFAQETVIFYPDLYSGYTIVNVEPGAGNTADLWAGSDGNDIRTDISDLGYTPRAGDIRGLRVHGYHDTYSPTDSYCVMDAVDLSIYDQSSDFKVTFCINAQYYKSNPGNHGTTFTVLLTTKYSGDPANTDWEDVTHLLDQIDDHVSYDGLWSKSTLMLNDYKMETDLVLAFRYNIKGTGTVDTSNDRPGRWKLAEVRFATGDYPTSMDEQSEQTQLFKPNPASDYIDLLAANVNVLELYDMSGKQVLAVNSPQGRVDLSSLPKGVYIVKVSLASGTVETRKLVKR